jgi:hypothetical protein
MNESHRRRVQALLQEAAAEHVRLVSELPPEVGEALPVDAQGLTRAIDDLAIAAGFSDDERHALISQHAVNPAVLHARVFGLTPITRQTVVGAFVEGARVRAEALATLADAVGGESLGQEIRTLLTTYPPPVSADGPTVVPALRATYAAHERAAVMIATSLDERSSSAA